MSILSYDTSKMDNYAYLSGVITLWYSSSIITIISTKVIMNIFQFPYFLGCFQFFVASFISLSYLYVFKLRKSNYFSLLTLHLKITLSYAIGILIFNVAMTITSANFIELIRTIEPITSSILGCIYLSENISIYAYIAIVPILCGVFLSFNQNVEGFHILGFILGMLCNLLYSIRNTQIRILKRDHEDCFDQLNIYADMHSYGLIILIPIMMLMENHFMEIFYQDNILHNTSTINMKHSNNNDNSIEKPSISGVLLLFLIILNGFCFTCENLMSNIILEKTDLIVHSVLNTFRRMFTVSISALYFHILLSNLNILGIFITILSIGLFGYFKIYHVNTNSIMKTSFEYIESNNNIL